MIFVEKDMHVRGEVGSSVFSGTFGLFKFQMYDVFGMTVDYAWKPILAYATPTLSSVVSGCHATLVTERLILFGSLNIITVLVEIGSDMNSGSSPSKYSSKRSS